MADLKLFIPLTKVDAEQRLVYGVATAETLDRSGEICDYASTKPYYEQWSAGVAKATGGKSLGNVRAMHGKIAAGKLTDINFDDENRRIEVVAKVVDDAEWKKVLEGVYTGFSHGGRYVKKWTDPNGNKLYTAEPSELSLVDLPCLPEATFDVVKADGFETKHFAQRAFSDAEVAQRAYKIAKERNIADWEKVEALAKAELAAEHVTEAEIDVGAVEKYSDSQARDKDGKWAAVGNAAAAGAKHGAVAGAVAGAIEGAFTGAVAGGAPGAAVGAVVGAGEGAVAGIVPGAVVGVIEHAAKKIAAEGSEGVEPEDDKDADDKKKKTAKWVEPTHKQFWSCGCDGHEHVTKAEAVSCMKDRLAKDAVAESPEVVAARAAVAAAQDVLKGVLPDEFPEIADKEALVKAIEAVPSAKNPLAARRHVVRCAKALGAVDSLPEEWKPRVIEGGALEKGMWQISSFADLLGRLDSFCRDLEWERAAEGDGSPIPDQVWSAVETLAGVLNSYVVEETKELLARPRTDPNGVTPLAMAAGLSTDQAMALRKFISEDALAKALDARAADASIAQALAALEKYGARNSAKDSATLQAIHDHSTQLGAKCSGMEEGAEKAAGEGDLAKVAAENEVLKAELSTVTLSLQELSKKVAVLEKLPAPAKAAVFAVSKAADGGTASEAPEDALLKKLSTMTPEQRSQELMKLALRVPTSAVQ